MDKPQYSPPWSAAVKIIVVTFILVIVGAILLHFQDILAPLVIACLIAYTLTPIVNFVNAHTRISRGIVTAAIYLLAFGLIALSISLLAPPLARQAISVQLNFQKISNQIGMFLSQPLQIGDLKFDLSPLYDELIATLSSLIRPLATQTMTLLAEVVNIVIDIILIGIVSFYLTKDGPIMSRWLSQWIPPHLRYDFKRLKAEIQELWRAFFRGQVLLALTMGLIISITMTAAGMKNALILGILAFFLEFLSSIGHGIWLLIAIPLALLQGSLWIPINNFWFAALILGIHMVLEQLDVNYLIPRIVGRKVKLHPMVIIIGIIVGGTLAGVLGMLLAAPTIATAGLLARYLYHKLLNMPPWQEAPDESE